MKIAMRVLTNRTQKLSKYNNLANSVADNIYVPLNYATNFLFDDLITTLYSILERLRNNM